MPFIPRRLVVPSVLTVVLCAVALRVFDPAAVYATLGVKPAV